MNPPQDLVTRVLDLNTEKLLDEGVGEIMSRGFPAGDRKLRPRAVVGSQLEGMPVPELPQFEADLEDERTRLFEAGARGLAKVRKDREAADLTPDERWGLEAITWVEGRPAILIQGGRFFPPPARWQVLEEVRDTIEETFQSVGRIELQGHPSYDWVGTGFLVADDVVMTNRHVAEVFCQIGSRRRWKFKSGMSAAIDYIEDLGAVESAEFQLRSVIGVHDDFDLALFRVRRTSDSGAQPPQPLVVASEFAEAQPGRQVYIVGYPAWDGFRNDPPIMQRIFCNLFDIKRLQPGAIMDFDGNTGVVRHDCSTLGGNSGSCVVDLESNLVVGLHFGGRFFEGNVAVALWKLTSDPLLERAKVNFD